MAEMGAVAIAQLVMTAIAVGTSVYALMTAESPESLGSKVQKRGTNAPRKVPYGRFITDSVNVYNNVYNKDSDWMLNVFCLGVGEVTEIENVYVNDLMVLNWIHNSTSPNDNPSFYFTRNNGDFVNAYETQDIKMQFRYGKPTEVASNLAILYGDGEWTSAHRGDRTAQVIMAVNRSTDADTPIMSSRYSLTAMVKGLAIHDPRYHEVGEKSFNHNDTGNPVPPDANKCGQNPALCLLDFLTDDYYGLAIPYDYIDLNSFKDAANWCDSKLIQINGSVDTGESFGDGLAQILSSFQGILTIEKGLITCKYEDEVVAPYPTTFDENNTIELSDFVNTTNDNYYNVVEVEYKNRAMNEKMDVYQIPENTSYIPSGETMSRIESDGFIKTKKIEMPMTSDLSTVKIFANRAYIKSLYQQGVSLTLDLSVHTDLSVYDVIKISNSTFGWVNKLFRITNIDKSVSSEDFNIGDITCIEYDDGMYNGTLNGTTGSGRLRTYQQLDAVTNLTFNLKSFIVDGYGVLSWEDTNKTTSVEYIIEYKLSTSTDWEVFSVTKNTSIKIPNLKSDDYDFRIQSTKYGWIRSVYTELLNQTIAPISTYPQITNVTSTSDGLNFNLKWDSMLESVAIVVDPLNPDSNGISGKVKDFIDYYKIIAFRGLTEYEYTTKTAEFVYNIDMNTSDGLSRSVDFEIYIVGKDGIESIAATHTATNEQMGLSIPVIDDLGGQIRISWATRDELDFKGTEVHLSTSASYTPDINTLVADVQGSVYSMNFPDDGIERFVRIGHYDTFGKDSIGYSAPLSTVYNPIETDIERNFQLDITPSLEWNDTSAFLAITSVGAEPRAGDQVMLYNSAPPEESAGYSETRFLDVDLLTWLPVSKYIDGNLLVDKTIGAEKLIVQEIFAENVDVTGTLTIGSTGAKVTLSGSGDTPFSIKDSDGVPVLETTTSGELTISGEFTGKLADGIINNPSMFSQTVLDAIIYKPEDSTGGTYSTNANSVVSIFTTNLEILSANTENVSITYDFRDDKYFGADMNYSWDLDIHREVNGSGVWTLIHQDNAASIIQGGDHGEPLEARLTISGAVTDGALVGVIALGDAVKYRLTLTRSAGNTTGNNARLLGFGVSQVIQGGNGSGGQPSFNDRLGELVGKMWAGEVVNIACYGDSTTDGNNTTGWIANPTSGGNAVGLVNHNTQAPNAWASKLQPLLREIFKNNNINTWNAGYSGKRIDDGWALANYQQAVIDNPYYGNGTPPDICFIGFGLNDIQSVGSQIDDHIYQSKLLIKRIISDGSIPILLTTDPEYRNGTGSVRDHKEAVREIDAAKKTIADYFGIQIFDMNTAIKGWAQNNNDGYTWAYEQNDGLHFGDKGHAFKASFVSSMLWRDLITFKGGVKYINTWDSAASYVGDYSTRYKYPNNKQGGNIIFTTGAPSNTDIMELLIWNESPNAYLIYLGIDNENYTSYTTKPSIKTKDFITGNEVSKDIISVGGFNSSYRRSDEQFIHSRLKYGLNKIKYRSGDSSALFYGSWKIVESTGITPWKSVDSILSLPTNALTGYSRFRRGYSANSGVHVTPIGELPELCNTVGCFDGGTVSISYDAIIPQYGGILLLSGQGFTGTQGAINDELQTGAILYRELDDTISLRNIRYNNLNQVVIGDALFYISGLNWTNNKFVGRIEISKSGNNQNIKIYDSYRGGNILTNTSISLGSSIRWSGFVGGLVYNSNDANISASVEISRLEINRDVNAAKIDTPEIGNDVDLIEADNIWLGDNTFSKGYVRAVGDYLSTTYSYGAVMGASGSLDVAIFGLGTDVHGSVALSGLRVGLTSLQWLDADDGLFDVYHGNNLDTQQINLATQTALDTKATLIGDNVWSGDNQFTGNYIDCKADYNGNNTSHSAVMGTSQTTGVAIFGVRNSAGSGVANAGIRVSTGGLQWYNSGSTYDVYHVGNKPPVPVATSSTFGGFKYTLTGGVLNLITV